MRFVTTVLLTLVFAQKSKKEPEGPVVFGLFLYIQPYGAKHGTLKGAPFLFSEEVTQAKAK